MAYGTNAELVRTPRGTEYAAFARVTNDLRAAAKLGSKNFQKIAEAIHKNRLLWTALAADVAGSGNALPEALRAQIFYLAEFVQHHSSKVLRGQARITALVEINIAIMRGLGTERYST
jgi:flagellar protein FlaF